MIGETFSSSFPGRLSRFNFLRKNQETISGQYLPNHRVLQNPEIEVEYEEPGAHIHRLVVTNMDLDKVKSAKPRVHRERAAQQALFRKTR